MRASSTAVSDASRGGTDGTLADLETMNVCVTVQHPAHVHFFKHSVWALEEGGHDVQVLVRNGSVATALLDEYGIDHEVIGRNASSVTGLAASQAVYEARMLRRAYGFEPDVVTAIGGVGAAHVARAVGARSVVFTDTEHATLVNLLAKPFADAIYTPECFHADFGAKQVRYPGYHELAYLHPDRFDPDPSILDDVGVGPEEKLVVLRLISWGASHDVGAVGIDDVSDVVERLEALGARVLITAEGDVPSEVADRQVSVAPHRMHDLLANATLFIGEGATMAAESAVLGTPALYVNSLRMGYTDELEARYGLLYNFQGSFRRHNALETAEAILAGQESHDWERAREQLLAEKTDTTDVILSAITDGRD